MSESRSEKEIKKKQPVGTVGDHGSGEEWKKWVVSAVSPLRWVGLQIAAT